MNIKSVLGIVALLVIVVMSGCASNDYTGYASYDNPQQAQQQKYVGGGCGVTAPVDSGDIVVNEDSLIEAL